MKRSHFWEIAEIDFRTSGSEMYAETIILILRLGHSRLYTISQAAQTAAAKGSPTYKRYYQRLSTFMSSKLIVPDEEGKDGLPSRWYGRSFKEGLKDKDWFKGEILSTLPKLVSEIQKIRGEKEKKDLMRNKKRTTVFKRVKKAKRTRFLKRFLLSALVISTLFLGMGLSAQMFFPGVFEKLIHDGFGSAVDYAKKTSYEQAWIDYRAGKYERAEQKVFSLLTENLSSKKRADCFYLLGELKKIRGSLELSKGYLLEAYRIYESEERFANLYYCALILSNVEVALGDFDTAKETLELALSNFYLDQEGYRKIPHLGMHHVARGYLLFHGQDFEDALQNAHEGLEIFKVHDEKDYIAERLSELGFLYTAIGCVEAGFFYTSKATKAIRDLKDERKHIYNEVNTVFLQRAFGYEPDPLIVSEIQAWATMSGDRELAWHLRLALNLSLKELPLENCYDPFKE